MHLANSVLEFFFKDAPGPGVDGRIWDGEGSQPDILRLLPGQEWAEQAALHSKSRQAEVRSLTETALNIRATGPWAQPRWLISDASETFLACSLATWHSRLWFPSLDRTAVGEGQRPLGYLFPHLLGTPFSNTPMPKVPTAARPHLGVLRHLLEQARWDLQVGPRAAEGLRVTRGVPLHRELTKTEVPPKPNVGGRVRGPGDDRSGEPRRPGAGSRDGDEEAAQRL